MKIVTRGMEKLNQKFIIVNALKITFFLILYFHLMEILGFGQILWLRAINGIILAVGIFLAIRSLKKNDRGDFNYFKGITTGFLIGMVNAFAFALYVSVYLLVFNQQFFTAIQEINGMGKYVNAVSVPAVLFVEHTVVGYFISFACMQLIKKRVTEDPL